MKTIAISLVCLFLISCEQKVTNPSWPEYKERIVCSANVSIYPDSTSVTCNLGRTVPLNQKFDFVATRINDAQVMLTRSTDTARLMPAQMPWWWGFEYFNYARMLPSNGDKTYALECQWGSLALHGVVMITTDLRLQLDTIMFVPDPWYPDGISGRFFLRVMPDFDYEVTLYSPTILDPSTFSFYPEDVPPEGKLMVTSYPLKKGQWTYTIMARNRNYRDHYANSGGDVFDPSGGNPRHNMTGDGIGFLTYDITGPRIPFDVK